MINGRLFRIKRLEIEMFAKFGAKAAVFRNANGDLVTLAHELPVHKSGNALGSKGYEDEGRSYTAIIEETDATFTGHPFDERGLVKPDTVTLKKSEWTKVLENGDPVVSLHIPAEGRLDPETIDETLEATKKFIADYMPDFKYASAELAAKYSAAPDYCKVAERALAEMYRQVGKYKYSSDKTLTRGVLIRHLVLPSCRKDSIEVLHRIAKTVPAENVLLSLMSQYTPDFALDTPHKELYRRITRFEYDSVLSVAEELGFDGFVQHASSASAKYTPDFVGGEK